METVRTGVENLIHGDAGQTEVEHRHTGEDLQSTFTGIKTNFAMADTDSFKFLCEIISQIDL